MKCNEEQVRRWIAAGAFTGHNGADLAADWLEMRAEITEVRDHADRWRKSWNEADTERQIAESTRDALAKRLADAEAEIDYLRRIGKAYQATALDRAKEGK